MARCGATGNATVAGLQAPAPVWSHSAPNIVYFAPRGADLNGDGRPEIIVTGGEESPPDGEVVALDGVSGNLLWRVPALYQLYGSPVFLDVTGDGVKDVFAGGRHEEFFGIDGASGALLWRFVDKREMPDFYLYNFHTAVLIGDQTGDGLPDLLVANGGGDGIEPYAPRPPGHVAVLGSKDGSLVAIALTPDLEESYMSPVLLPDDGAASPTILIGTGGETRAGGLYQTSLASVLAGDLSGAKLLIKGVAKGVIAPPALADLDRDGRLDIIVALFDGRLVALSGATHQILWQHVIDSSESYSTPTLGFFDADEIPDVFAVFLRGQFPEYSSVTRVMLSGRDGAVLWQGDTGDFALAGDIAVDLDDDGIDEVIFNANNSIAEGGVQQQLYLVDTAKREARAWGTPLGAFSPGSPWMGDLDADGCLDLVVPRLTLGTNAKEAVLTRFQVAAPVPPTIRWGGYLGTDFDLIVRGPRRR
jgi:outer membrane protein assembly factor BamB